MHDRIFTLVASAEMIDAANAFLNCLESQEPARPILVLAEGQDFAKVERFCTEQEQELWQGIQAKFAVAPEATLRELEPKWSKGRIDMGRVAECLTATVPAKVVEGVKEALTRESMEAGRVYLDDVPVSREVLRPREAVKEGEPAALEPATRG